LSRPGALLGIDVNYGYTAPRYTPRLSISLRHRSSCAVSAHGLAARQDRPFPSPLDL
jgi:hypothetical protein